MKLLDKHIAIGTIDTEAYISDSVTHKLFKLNDSAAFIARKLKQGLSVETVANDLMDAYDIVEKKTARMDIKSFISDLDKHDVLNRSNSARKVGVQLKSLTLGITSKCNLSCKHCLAGNSLHADHELSYKKICSIIGELEEMNVKSVGLFGGEPMMHSRIFDVIDFISDTSLNFSMNTNATLIDDDAVRKFKDSRLKSFCVSLDGASANVHDPFRGAKSFEKTISAIKRLIAAGFNVMISTIVSKYNHLDCSNIVSLGKQLGVGSVRFNNTSYAGNAACFASSLMLSPEETFAVGDEIAELQAKYKNDFVTGSVIQMKGIIDKCKAGEFKRSFPILLAPCGAAMGRCCIRPDGFITPCELMWDTVGRNIHEFSLKEIWEDDEVLNSFRRPVFLSNQDLLDECHDCEFIRLCYQGHRCFFNDLARCDKRQSKVIGCLKSGQGI